ncbi:MAG: rhodanese-like domain-containing protein [Tumebacillaceae bacterium]
MAQIIDGVNQISADELKEKLEESGKNVKFIDVREPGEYDAGHIPGVPLIPMNQIPARFGEVGEADEYVFICRSGNRSHMVAKFLKDNGIENVTNFNGGMLSWSGPIKQGMEE